LSGFSRVVLYTFEEPKRKKISPDTAPTVKRATIIKVVYFLFLLSLAGIFVGFYGRTLLLRGRKLYQYAKQNRRGWSGTVFEPDRELGFRAKPGAEGGHTFPIGEDIPMRFDHNGFRVPPDSPGGEYHRPYVLALGCSFTYGDACRAEDTFPHLAARELGGSGLNAGLPSYGLSQMLILARKLIPEYRPDYILFQYSPWLLNRSTRLFAPTRFSIAPNPYFIDGEDGSIELHPPVFTPYTVDISPWRDTPASKRDFFSFFFRAALPLLLHDDSRILVFKLKAALSLIPPPSENTGLIVEEAYREIRELAAREGSKLIIVGLGNFDQPLPMPEIFPELDLTAVNCHAELLRRLPAPDEYSYSQAYCHFRGDPPRRVDRHPNPDAHQIIADSILKAIRENDPARAAP